MELYDETSGSSNGLVFYDVHKRLRFKKIFNEKWICSDSQWFLRAGDGGLLIYSCKRNGILQVVNPLTMQSHYLEDARLTRKSKLSYYMKKYHDDVAVQLNFDPKDKSYEVTVIIGNLNILRSKKFIVLIYKSADKIWDIRNAHFEEPMSGHMTVSFFPSVSMQNKKIYLSCKSGVHMCMCDLNGNGNIRYHYHLWLIQRTMGIVMYKGRMIKVCNGQHPYVLEFYEFDEVDGKWRSKYEAIVSPKNMFPGVICVGGDYIWIICEIGGYARYVLCIDIDCGELKIWPRVDPFLIKVRKCLSMPLSFRPCY